VHILIAALIACLPGAAQEPGFHPLFDGKTLQGWSGDSRLWKVEDGLLAGTTEGVPPIDKNTFLIHKSREFGDFILRFDVKLRNGNSGVQFRSEELPDFVVKGLQADMAENNWWGSIYDERGTRGVMVNGWKGKAETVVKPNDWNEVELSAKGDHIQIRVNGLLTADLHDSVKLKGILALQLHRGPPMRVWFRNIRIKPLN
jgi:hypothetical protein